MLFHELLRFKVCRSSFLVYYVQVSVSHSHKGFSNCLGWSAVEIQILFRIARRILYNFCKLLHLNCCYVCCGCVVYVSVCACVSACTCARDSETCHPAALVAKWQISLLFYFFTYYCNRGGRVTDIKTLEKNSFPAAPGDGTHDISIKSLAHYHRVLLGYWTHQKLTHRKREIWS